MRLKQTPAMQSFPWLAVMNGQLELISHPLRQGIKKPRGMRAPVAFYLAWIVDQIKNRPYPSNDRRAHAS
jgi:hypothetical protein